MRLFNFSKKEQAFSDSKDNLVLAIQEQIPNLDLLYVSDLRERDIPSFGNGIEIKIVFENGIPKISEEEKLDPSTIFRTLPISSPEYVDNVERLPYWPSYASMLPEQRFVYLTWLKDVTQEIDMGYVFVYYYGLERQLLFGNFEKAFNEIMKLRRYHKNRSFQNYSEDALIFSCFYNNRFDMLLQDYGDASLNRFSNIQLEFAITNNLNLSVQNIISVFKEIKLYKSTIKGYEEIFEKCVLNTLVEQYQNEYFPLDKFDITRVKDKTEQGFANYSFPEELRCPLVKDVLNFKDFITEVTKIFSYSYDDFKKEKSILKKAQKDNLTKEQKEELKEKKEKARLKKLYDTHVLKRDEYELLLNNLIEKHSTFNN